MTGARLSDIGLLSVINHCHCLSSLTISRLSAVWLALQATCCAMHVVRRAWKHVELVLYHDVSVDVWSLSVCLSVCHITTSSAVSLRLIDCTLASCTGSSSVSQQLHAVLVS